MKHQAGLLGLSFIHSQARGQPLNQVRTCLPMSPCPGVAAGEQQSGKAMFDALYANRKQLEAMFAFFDKDGNGSISRCVLHIYLCIYI